MRAWTLGSGSKGNAILLEGSGTRVLVDCGYSPRTMTQRLAPFGIVPESIDAVVLTHEHIDHTKGILSAHKKFGWQVYGSVGTLTALRELPAGARQVLAPGATTSIGNLDIVLLRVPHDAAEPTAVLATDRTTGFRTGIAHDLGEVPEPVAQTFERLDLALIESNHDEEMLRNGPYPGYLKDRVASRNGHLSNRQSGQWIARLWHPWLRGVVLLHLSETNNTPAIATAAARAVLRKCGSSLVPAAAPQSEAAGPFGLPVTTQLALGL